MFSVFLSFGVGLLVLQFESLEIFWLAQFFLFNRIHRRGLKRHVDWVGQSDHTPIFRVTVILHKLGRHAFYFAGTLSRIRLSDVFIAINSWKFITVFRGLSKTYLVLGLPEYESHIALDGTDLNREYHSFSKKHWSYHGSLSLQLWELHARPVRLWRSMLPLLFSTEAGILLHRAEAISKWSPSLFQDDLDVSCNISS